MDLWPSIHRALLDAGCAGAGVASADPFTAARASIESRKEAGMHAGMHFTFGDPHRSTDIRASFPWAQSIVVAGRAYLPEAGSPGEPVPNRGRVARFATADHYRDLRSALVDAAGRLTGSGHRAEVVVDDNRLVDRAAAVRAGVGWWGKNTMVLAPKAGPWMLLGSVVTDAALPPSPPMVRDCGTCEACLPACPTGALVAPGVLDARRCLAHVLQAPGWIPVELRGAAADRIYGCDDCLDACPPGRHLEAATLPRPRLELIPLLAMPDDALLARFSHFYVPRRRASYLRRNILVALGNSGDGRAVPPVTACLDSVDPMLRAHAAWALGQLGGQAARSALATAAGRENSPAVTAEITRAAAHLAAE